MSGLTMISAADVEGKLTWRDFVDAIKAGHQLPAAELGDQFLHRQEDTMLSRSAWIDGLGVGVKSVTVLPNNAAKGLRTIHGAMVVFDDQTGQLRATIDSAVITYWKTASDSVYGATLLARPESETLLIVGAGVVAESLVRAYSEVFPSIANISIFNRSPERAVMLAKKLRAEGFPSTAVTDLEQAAARADIISCATMSTTPVLQGDWVQPGTHVDLIGAFKPDMREADDQLLRKSKLFVDNRDTTLDHIGELMLPLASGAISRSDVVADLYQLTAGAAGRTSNQDITVYKNGGGAHLDLMAADVIIRAVS